MIDIGNKTVYMGGAMPEEKGTSGSGLELLDTLESFNLNFIPGGVTPEEWATVYGPSPLLLPKAKANSLQYVKAFGSTEQNGTPTPTVPVDIVSNNGVLKVGWNTIPWNTDNSTEGYYKSDGTYVDTHATMRTTDYYAVQKSATQVKYTYSGESMMAPSIAFFDSNKQLISAVGFGDSGSLGTYTHTFTIPANTVYIKFPWRTTRTSTTVEFNCIYTDGTVETIEITGKNLFDEQWNRNTGTSTAAATWGQVVSANGWSTSDLIPVKAGQQYTISYNTTVPMYVFYYKSDGTMRQSYDMASDTKKTFTVPNGAVNVRLQVNKSTEAQIAALETQLELGSTATTYVPYYDGGTATAEMLLKVGNYQDVQSIIDGVVTRNVGVLVLDGTEGWTQSAATNNLFYATISNSSTDNTYIPISSHFQGVVASTGYATMTNGQFKHGSSTNSWYFKNTDCANASAFSQYLAGQYAAGTPVILVYPLATPTTESVTGQTLQVQAGNNTLEITQASLNNLTLEAKYRRNK